MQIPVQKITKKITRYFPYIVILVLAILLFKQCEKSENAIAFLENQNKEVKVYKNKIGTLTASVSSSELSNNQLKKLVLQKNDSLKLLASEFNKVKYITTIKEVTKIDTVYIEFGTEIPVQFERFGKYDIDSHFKFNYALNQSGLSLSDIEIPNKQTIITGTKRNWIFGKQYLTTDITNSNPYIQTTEIQSVVIPVGNEWYNSKWLWFGVGAVGGALLAN